MLILCVRVVNNWNGENGKSGPNFKRTWKFWFLNAEHLKKVMVGLGNNQCLVGKNRRFQFHLVRTKAKSKAWNWNRKQNLELVQFRWLTHSSNCELIRTGIELGLNFKTKIEILILIFWKSRLQSGFPIPFMCGTGSRNKIVLIYFLEPESELLHKCKELPKLEIIQSVNVCPNSKNCIKKF